MRLQFKSFQNFVRVFLLCGILQFNASCSSDDPAPQPPIVEEKEEKPEEPEIEQGDKLPSITINTRSNTIVDEPKVDATMSISEKGSESYSGAIGIEFRGASSQSFPKKSFGLETRDENNEDLDVLLLGFPEEEDWILYGPYSDKSLMRNVLISAYRFNERCPEDFWQIPFWWDRLLQDPNFVQQLKERWADLRGNVFSESALLSKIETYTATLEMAGAVNANFDQWPVLGTYIWPNNFVGKTYVEETGYLKGWISDRLIWLDGAIDGL